MAIYTIGELTGTAGVGVETLRFIRPAEVLGFTLAEIADGEDGCFPLAVAAER